MTRKQAVDLLHENMKNQNLRKHCYAVEAVMKALAKYFKENEDTWGIAGLLHDADYELTKDNAKKEHTKHILDWLKKFDAETDVHDAIAAHAWGYVDGAPEPKMKMQWALYCCDELTGLIVAVALVKPDKRLASVTVDSIMKKWNSQSFAAGVDRKQIGECEPRLGVPLREFIQVTLTAMQGISKDLGL
ncbi:MAG: HDIG domain-containing metalloprotein [Patescibacteria group bacterium]